MTLALRKASFQKANILGAKVEKSGFRKAATHTKTEMAEYSTEASISTESFAASR
jgi:hypothetical protein